MPDSPPRSRQEAQIQKAWPRAAKQLVSTYFRNEDWAVTTRDGRNNAGYMLWALARMETKVQFNHGAKQFTRDECDLAASREIYYQWTNNRHFQNTSAALATCLLNLAIERPEKFMEARRLQGGQVGGRGSSAVPCSSGPSMGIPSLLPGLPTRQRTTTLTGSDLQTSTRPSSGQQSSPEPWLRGVISTGCVWVNCCGSSQRIAGQIATVA